MQMKGKNYSGTSGRIPFTENALLQKRKSRSRDFLKPLWFWNMVLCTRCWKWHEMQTQCSTKSSSTCLHSQLCLNVHTWHSPCHSGIYCALETSSHRLHLHYRSWCPILICWLYPNLWNLLKVRWADVPFSGDTS